MCLPAKLAGNAHPDRSGNSSGERGDGVGEINAICQMLGHPEIFFVGGLVGNLEWSP